MDKRLRLVRDNARLARACPVCRGIHHEEVDAAIFCTGWSCTRIHALFQKTGFGSTVGASNMAVVSPPRYGRGSFTRKVAETWPDYCSRLRAVQQSNVALGYLSEKEAARLRVTYFGRRFEQGSAPGNDFPPYARWYSFVGLRGEVLKVHEIGVGPGGPQDTA